MFLIHNQYSIERDNKVPIIDQDSIEIDSAEPVIDRIQSKSSPKNSEVDNKCKNLTGNPDDDPDYPFHRGFVDSKDFIDYCFDVITVMDSDTFVLHILSVGITPTQAVRFLNHL